MVRTGRAAEQAAGSGAATATLADTVWLLARGGAQQDTTTRILRAGLENAQGPMERLLEDRRRADAAREALGLENDRLGSSIGAGLEATKPSRGRVLGFWERVAGARATTGAVGGMCGVSLRRVLGNGL